MHYISTRNAEQRFLLGEAIARGLAPDGGLLVPEDFPHFTTRQFEALRELPEIGARLLTPFAAGDPLADELRAICEEAFNFPAMLRPLPEAPAPLSVLELFHGPTSAFKDFGARFLASCMERIRRGNDRKLTILVATSG
ncbi:MAG: threonine synthase, partial [Steroidobacteraceae bacterium]